MTGELTETAQTLSSIVTGGRRAIERDGVDRRGDLEQRADRRHGGDTARQFGPGDHGPAREATDIVQRASGMAEEANRTIGALASAAQRIDEVVELHPHHRRADQPAGAQRHDRGGTRRRGGPGFCGRRFRSEGAGDSDREGDRGDLVPDRRGAGGDQAGGGKCRRHRADHGRHRRFTGRLPAR